MGKVNLVGFDLDDVEMSIINKVIDKHTKRINERIGFEELKLDLRKKKHGKTYLHEIHASLKMKKNTFNSDVTDYNLLKAISESLNKLITESEHTIRK